MYKKAIIITTTILLLLILLYLRKPVKTYYLESMYTLLYKNEDEYIKKIIELDYPQVNNPQISDFERTSMLRQWVATTIDRGSPKTRINHHDLDEKSLKEIYEYFLDDSGSVECGGISQLLMRLYKLYGFTAYKYDSGSADTFNHVITLVKINHNDKEIFAIQDATYDVTYITQNGDPYDFYDFLSKIKANQLEDIFVLEGVAKPPDYICISGDTCTAENSTELKSPISENKFKYEYKPSTRRVYSNMKEQTYLDFKYIDSTTEWNPPFHVKKIHSIIGTTEPATPSM